MTSKYQEQIDWKLEAINSRIKNPKYHLSLGGESNRDGIKNPIEGGYIGNLVANKSQLNDCLKMALDILSFVERQDERIKKAEDFQEWQRQNQKPRHVFQNNYNDSPIPCDICQDIPKNIILCGSGWRECINCHLRRCDDCKIEVR